jgi:hypothetical protein
MPSQRQDLRGQAGAVARGNESNVALQCQRTCVDLGTRPQSAKASELLFPCVTLAVTFIEIESPKNVIKLLI